MISNFHERVIASNDASPPLLVQDSLERIKDANYIRLPQMKTCLAFYRRMASRFNQRSILKLESERV